MENIVLKEITGDMYLKLKEPLPKEAVKPHPSKPYLSSIKAIYVTERLNDVFGCGKWQIRVEKISENDSGMVVIKTTLLIPDYNIYYESYGGNDNGGQASKNFDLGDAYKGATTDGITKIGSYLGIGISVFKGLGNVPINDVNLNRKIHEQEIKELAKLAKNAGKNEIDILDLVGTFGYSTIREIQLKDYHSICKLV